MNNIKIVIDGVSAAGKGTISKRIAKDLDITYLSCGLFYRSCGYFIGNGIYKNITEVKNAFLAGNIEYIWDGKNVNLQYKSQNLLSELESSKSAKLTSELMSQGENPAQIREFIRTYSSQISSFIGDGRNLGSSIFPEVENKFYFEADLRVRAIRRLTDLRGNGEFIDLRTIYKDLKVRDEKDRTRVTDPMIIPNDATIIDTTGKTIEGVLKEVYSSIPELKHRVELSDNKETKNPFKIN